jgi:hypothetical protein
MPKQAARQLEKTIAEIRARPGSARIVSGIARATAAKNPT